ncbi:MAG: Undecaprenyl-diphosphatase [Anaerolineales bacterium]|nr:Undecaprenyl-diphosphatase [Anaerolineales bacterium]
MNLFQSILLGILQGLTEFIPVSSTAHLLIGQTLLDIPASDAMFSFLVIVQLGTLVSLFAFYWKDLLAIFKATLNFRHSTAERNLGFCIVIATIPALLAGYLLKDAVETLFQQPMLEAGIRLITAAALLALAEWLTKKNRNLDSLTWLDALFVGAMQVIAVFPGASRSGATISGGMFRGFDRPSAARFAFLLSAPVMLAAGGYELLDVIQTPNIAAFLPLLAAGFVTAAIVGWFAIKWLIGYLSKHSLYIFAVYCAVIGTAALVASFKGA